MNDIEKPDDLVSIGTHLTRTEADSIKSSLTAINIDYLLKGHHAASRFNSLYYEIKVKKKSRRIAKEILGKMRAKALSKTENVQNVKP